MLHLRIWMVHQDMGPGLTPSLDPQPSTLNPQPSTLHKCSLTHPCCINAHILVCRHISKSMRTVTHM